MNNHTDKNTNNEIQGQFSKPDTKSWFEYSWKLQQDVPARYEDAAKFLATMISLSLTIVTTALDKLKVISFFPAVLLVSLTIWLIALFLPSKSFGRRLTLFMTSLLILSKKFKLYG